MPVQNKYTQLFERFKKDPVYFVEKGLGHKTWSKQREILESVRDNPRTSVIACHGSSKTFTAAEVAMWFFKTYYPAVVIVTAPVWRQVKNYMFMEMKKLYSTAKIDLGSDDLLQTEIKWIGSNGKPHPEAKIIGVSTDDPTKFEGWHSANILLLADECRGIESNLFPSFDGLLTSHNSRMLLFSTGGSDSSEYAKTFTTNRSLYNTITIDAFSTPFFPQNIKRKDYKDHDTFSEAVYKQWKSDCTNPEYKKDNYEWPLELMPKIGMVTPEFERLQRVQWGSDSVPYKQKVFAMNVANVEEQLLSVAELEAVWANNHDNLPDKESIDYPNPKAGSDNIGADVGFENDRCCIVRKQGNTFTDIDIVEGSDSVKMSFFITNKYTNHRLQVNVDANGIGKGLYDDLKHMGQRANPIYASEKPNNAKFINLRAELFWLFREAIRNKELWFLIDKSKMDLVIEEFTSIRFFSNIKGQIQIASKKDIKKVLHRSPDVADAIVISTAKPSIDYEALKRRKAELENNMNFNDLGRI